MYNGVMLVLLTLDVANAPGTKIYPGELKKALDLLAKGKKIYDKRESIKEKDQKRDMDRIKNTDSWGSTLGQALIKWAF